MRNSTSSSVFAACVSVAVALAGVGTTGCLADGTIEGPATASGGATSTDDAGTSSNGDGANDAGKYGDSSPGADAGPSADVGISHDAESDSSGAHDAATHSPDAPDAPAPTDAPAATDAPTGGTQDAHAETPTTPPPSDPIEAARVKCVDEINQYRATLGLKPYARWTPNEACVDTQSAADGAAGVAHSAFGKCSEWAQNECPGWPGPAGSIMDGCLKMMWDEGPGEPFEAHGHYINMSSTSYTMVSCGFHQMPDGSWWATQDFK